MYVCMYVCAGMHGCMDGWMDGWMCVHAGMPTYMYVNMYMCLCHRASGSTYRIPSCSVQSRTFTKDVIVIAMKYGHDQGIYRKV